MEEWGRPEISLEGAAAASPPLPTHLAGHHRGAGRKDALRDPAVHRDEHDAEDQASKERVPDLRTSKQ